MNLKFTISQVLFVAASTIVATVLIKGAYDMYIKNEKVDLKNRPIVKYGMPFIAFVLLISYLFGS